MFIQKRDADKIRIPFCTAHDPITGHLLYYIIFDTCNIHIDVTSTTVEKNEILKV